MSHLLAVAKFSKGVSKFLLANRASSKGILLARRQIYWPRATGPVLISTPDGFCRAVRNGKQAKNSKWTFLSLPGIELATPSLSNQTPWTA